MRALQILVFTQADSTTQVKPMKELIMHLASSLSSTVKPFKVLGKINSKRGINRFPQRLEKTLTRMSY